MKIAAVLAVVAMLAASACDDDEPQAEPGALQSHVRAPGGLPSGEFSVCAFGYGDPESPEVLIGACSMPPKWDSDVPYLEEDGATGTSLPHYLEGQTYFERQLVTDPDAAAALRTRLRELAIECERDVDGCFSR